MLCGYLLIAFSALNFLYAAPVNVSDLAEPELLLQGDPVLAGDPNLTSSTKSLPLPILPAQTHIDDDGPYSREQQVVLSGLRVENVASEEGFLGFTARGWSMVKPDTEVRVVLFGIGFTDIAAVKFSRNPTCQDGKVITQENFSIMTFTRLVVLADFEEDETHQYFVCIAERAPRGQELSFQVFRDSHTHILSSLPPKKYYMNLYVQVIIVAVLLGFSGLFSGLNLGLMALTPQELRLIQKAGSKQEQRFAGEILPVRQKGNFLLCTLLLGNVIVNSGVSLLLENLTGSGPIALFVSTCGIVLFGEIIPQAICVKNGLQVGARTIVITRLFMLLTCLVSYPISKLLDLVLGEEISSFDRKRLIELIKLQCDNGELMANNEYRIALGALAISDKTVADVMTKIDDVFMLPTSANLDTRSVAEILRMGYTRIPIYEGVRNNVVSLLFVKDLALLDPEDSISVLTVCNFHQHVLRFVTKDTPLRFLLEEFKKGDYHLAMVHHLVSPDDADPYYELDGLVTLEDIFEEILQAEIVDETDAVIDNVNRKKRFGRKARDMAYLMESKNPSCVISMQMQLVTVQWLTSYHKVFSDQYISTSILEKLIRQHCRKVETSLITELSDDPMVLPRSAKLYTKSEYTEKCVLILEGRVLVTIGHEGMTFEAGPWFFFGNEILNNLITATVEDVNKNSTASLLPKNNLGFIADFTAVIRQECTFLEFSTNDWLLAYKSTLLTRRNSIADKPVQRSTSRSSLEDHKTHILSTQHSGRWKRRGTFV